MARRLSARQACSERNIQSTTFSRAGRPAILREALELLYTRYIYQVWINSYVYILRFKRLAEIHGPALQIDCG